jgi:hypothetical protein
MVITVGRAKNASSAMEARDLMAEGVRTLENYYLTTPEAAALEQLADIQKDLRRIPMVELNVPTVVLVGGDDDDHRIVMNVDEMIMLGPITIQLSPSLYHHTITITLSPYNCHQSLSLYHHTPIINHNHSITINLSSIIITLSP